MDINTIIQGGCLEVLKTLDDESVNCVVTSPPYWALRDYRVDGQLGLEKTFLEYIDKLCNIFDEVKRVLTKDGTCWVNMGDTYNAGGNYRKDGSSGRGYKYNRVEFGRVQNDKKAQGISAKCLCQIPSRFAIEMTNRGWILRNEIIWYKPNCMPSSVKDRFTVNFEKIYFFTKNKKYSFEQQFEPNSEATIKDIKSRKLMRWGDGSHNSKHYGSETSGDRKGRTRDEFFNPDGRNKRCVWKVNTKPFKEAHFAVFPEKLITTPIKAGCPKGGIVLDPFMGSGTTAVVARKLGRNYLGIELNPEYIKIAEKRLQQELLWN